MTQRTGLTLPAAYRSLGKHIYMSGAFREEFPNFYKTLDELTAQLKALVDQPSSRPAAEGIVAKEMAQAKALDLQGKQVLAQFGEAVYRKHGDQSGSAELMRRVSFAYLERKDESADLASHAHRLFTEEQHSQELSRIDEILEQIGSLLGRG
jgi:hypothetical protein